MKGMVVNGKNYRMLKGETWKFTYSMFIPSSLKATSSFTHIAQMKDPEPKNGQTHSPNYVMSLRRKGSVESIEAQATTGHKRLGSAPLKPLHDRWTDVELVYHVHDVHGSANLTLITDKKVVFNGNVENVNLSFGDSIRPKWGIYRSLDDKKQIISTYLLITKMKAYKLR